MHLRPQRLETHDRIEYSYIWYSAGNDFSQEMEEDAEIAPDRVSGEKTSEPNRTVWKVAKVRLPTSSVHSERQTILALSIPWAFLPSLPSL